MSDVEAEPNQLVGDGEIPADLLRPNWIAFAFAPIWAIIYRVWWVLWLFLGLIVASAAVSTALLWINEPAWAKSYNDSFIVFRVLWQFIPVIVALCANRWLWSSIAKRRARGDSSRRLELERYRKSMRSWTPFALAVLALELVVSIIDLVGGLDGAWYVLFQLAAIVGLFAYDRVLTSGSKANKGIEQSATS